MKDAKYYIKLILQSDHSYDEWKQIQEEVNEWINNCSEAECNEFTESGAGELLYMVCSAIDNIQKSTVQA